MRPRNIKHPAWLWRSWSKPSRQGWSYHPQPEVMCTRTCWVSGSRPGLSVSSWNEIFPNDLLLTSFPCSQRGPPVVWPSRAPPEWEVPLWIRAHPPHTYLQCAKPQGLGSHLPHRSCSNTAPELSPTVSTWSPALGLSHEHKNRNPVTSHTSHRLPRPLLRGTHRWHLSETGTRG